MIRRVRKIIVKLRMFYADIRGHHGKKWDYEPGEWYMGRHVKPLISEEEFNKRHDKALRDADPSYKKRRKNNDR